MREQGGDMDLQVQDKGISVSGGAKGIGEGSSKVLAGEGAIPFIIGRSEADNLATVSAIGAAGGKAYQFVAELTEPSACEQAVKAVPAQTGPIDGLGNNAGVNGCVGLGGGYF